MAGRVRESTDLHSDIVDLDVGEGDARLPRLWRLEDEVLESVAEVGILSGESVGEVICEKERGKSSLVSNGAGEWSKGA